MKIALLFLLTASIAQASYFAEYCSSADQSFFTQGGHIPSSASYSYMNHESGKKVVVELKMDSFKSETKSTSTVRQESKRVCSASGGGMVSWMNLKVVDKRISLLGDLLFPKNMPGVSADRKSLEVTLLCKHVGNSRSSCP